eukprot:TRINITY_DN3485_c0_g1_i1.p1 TRINITY_DN3485_c0_g1~~TRINITY_DN3485_c0_g1_i1.p1  ORF type:complete len:518 (-),score=25.53 TRINITY_DN3485_c0_g1_i1:572-2125(-)
MASLFYTFLSLLFTSLLLVVLISHKNKKTGPKSLNLPPGPPGWPIIGNLLQYARSGKPFIHYIRDLHPIYGPIFTLRMGSRTLIVVTSAQLAHDALISQGQAFANRPAENPTRCIFSSNKFTVNSSELGPVWRSLRRNMVSNMLNSTRIREFQPLRHLALDRLVHRLRSESESNPDGSVWVLKNVRFAVFTILLSMCFGVQMDEEDIITIDRVMKRVLIALTPRLDDFLPLLSPLFAKQRKEATQTREEQIRVLVPFIHRRKSELKDPPANGKKTVSFSYLDTLFDLQIDGRKSSPSDLELVTLCSEFLNGGTDTTATAIEWAIVHLIEDPDLQEKLYKDIVTVTGERNAEEKDVEKMAYLNAFIKELLRKHPPTYFLLSHAAVHPGAKLGGYDVPNDANVEFYLPSISEDPKLWTNPERFDPERFLSGGEEADITGVTEVKMMPFGVGRRICPGLSMGTLHITLMIARMVQEFEWFACPPSRRTIDKSEKLEFTVQMRTPLQATIKPRNRGQTAKI